MAEYIVLAGKNTTSGEACKYEKTFNSLEEALKAREDVEEYPWYRIVVREGNFEYSIDPRRIRLKMDDATYLPCTPRGTLSTATTLSF